MTGHTTTRLSREQVENVRDEAYRWSLPRNNAEQQAVAADVVWRLAQDALRYMTALERIREGLRALYSDDIERIIEAVLLEKGEGDESHNSPRV